MKKIMFAVMAMFAIGFTSCGNKTQAPAEAADSVEAMVYNAEEEAAASINQLTEQIEAQDAGKFQEVLVAIQEKIKDIIGTNPEVAKEYVTKIQDFLKENADKIKAFAGDNQAVQAALATLTAAPADTVVDGLMQALGGAKEAVEGAVDDAAQAAEDSRISEAPNVIFDLQIAPEAEATMLHTNLAQATRAVVLLLDNAQKFLSAPNAPASEGTVRLIVSQTDTHAVFTIEDTGIGIPPEEAEHIFEEFVQLNDYYDGTGIGLTVARSIARRLGGDITLDTTYSPGARFVFTLPLS